MTDPACPRCGDPGPPHTVEVPVNPDAPSWDTWTVTLWQCGGCLHRFSRAAGRAPSPPFTVPRHVTVRALPRYL